MFAFERRIVASKCHLLLLFLLFEHCFTCDKSLLLLVMQSVMHTQRMWTDYWYWCPIFWWLPWIKDSVKCIFSQGFVSNNEHRVIQCWCVQDSAIHSTLWCYHWDFMTPLVTQDCPNDVPELPWTKNCYMQWMESIGCRLQMNYTKYDIYCHGI